MTPIPPAYIAHLARQAVSTPVMYLVEKFLAPEVRPAHAKQVQAIKDRMQDLMREMESLGAA